MTKLLLFTLLVVSGLSPAQALPPQESPAALPRYDQASFKRYFVHHCPTAKPTHHQQSLWVPQPESSISLPALNQWKTRDIIIEIGWKNPPRNRVPYHPTSLFKYLMELSQDLFRRK